MQWSLVLLSIVGLTTSSPVNTRDIEETFLRGDVTTRNAAIENVLRGLLEDLRQTMLTGTDTIPVLDPLEVPSVNIDENLLPGLTLSLNDLKVSKLSNFLIEEFNVQLTIFPLALRVAFDFQIPVLEVEAGQYDLQLFIDNFTLFGKGDAKINIIKPGISGHVLAMMVTGDNAIFLNLQEVLIKFTLAEFDSHINGLLGGDENLNAFLNTFLSYFVPDVVKLYEEEITNTVSGLVLVFGNMLLADLNLIDILG